MGFGGLRCVEGDSQSLYGGFIVLEAVTLVLLDQLFVLGVIVWVAMGLAYGVPSDFACSGGLI